VPAERVDKLSDVTDVVDVVVVGGGAMGTAAARSLAARGREVLVFERFEVGNALGSSGGPTRIFRLSYHHPDYVRMARLAIASWRALESEAGEPLLIPTGGLDLGDPDGLRAQALHEAGEAFTVISAEGAAERWPGVRFRSGVEVLVQDDAAVCLAERTIGAQARSAVAAGATILERTPVGSIVTIGPDLAEVRTADRTIRAPVVVVAAGAWEAGLLRGVGIDLPLRPTQEQVTYFRGGEAAEGPQPMPTIVDWTRDPIAYTVPDPTEPGSFKVALHLSGPVVDPDDRTTEADPLRVDEVVRYARETFPGSDPTGDSETCLYTNAPDEDFVLDRTGPVVIASPCSGHGFKFAPLVGELVADLATGAEPAVPLGRFASSRAALR
jgi:sarcosine oxidase